MKVGVPKEIKDRENRVAMTPEGARALVEAGHTVLVEEGAGAGSGFADSEYRRSGATMVSADQAWDVDLVVKVKEPLESEYTYLRQQIVFTYFHLAGVAKSLTQALLDSGTTAVAYETVEGSDGGLPLLAPMSAVAGNMAVTMGSYYLAKFNGGKGIQLGTVLDQSCGKVVVIGDGVVGRHAAKTADGMGANVFVLGRQTARFGQLAQDISLRIKFSVSTPDNVSELIHSADLVVGAVLLPGAKAPHVVTEEMVRGMQPGSVIVDVSIDQGGCVETSKPTSHSEPVFEKHGVLHYCVTNMPGAYPRTSTIALTDATLPFVLKLADKGHQAMREMTGLEKGVNTHRGYLTSLPVAEALSLMPKFKSFSSISE